MVTSGGMTKVSNNKVSWIIIILIFEKGVMRHLKRYNSVRVPFISNALKKTGRLRCDDDMTGLKVLDVGE